MAPDPDIAGGVCPEAQTGLRDLRAEVRALDLSVRKEIRALDSSVRDLTETVRSDMQGLTSDLRANFREIRNDARDLGEKFDRATRWTITTTIVSACALAGIFIQLSQLTP